MTIPQLLLFSFFLIAIATPAYASTGICVDQKPRIIIRTVIEETQYVMDRSFHDLTASHKGAQQRVGFDLVTGLGGGTTDLVAEIKFMESTRNETACVTLTQVDIVYSALPVIHIAENYPEDSCEYNAVLDHEKKHVFALENFHREYSMRLNDFVSGVLGERVHSGEIHVSGIESVKKNMESFLIENLEDFRNESMQVLMDRQNEIDTPEEYARIAAQCE